jgi:hypothetical protein
MAALDPAVSSAAARGLLHGNDQNFIAGQIQGKIHQAQQKMHDKIDALSQKIHKGHHTYATQTVLAAQPSIVIAPMPVLAPQQTLIAPASQPPPPTPTTNKTKSITIAGKGKSITLTKTTEVPVSQAAGFLS